MEDRCRIANAFSAAAKLPINNLTFPNHFNQERYLVSRGIYKERRAAALAAWQSVMGYKPAVLCELSPRGAKLALELHQPPEHKLNSVAVMEW
jgi:hypothetical protein